LVLIGRTWPAVYSFLAGALLASGLAAQTAILSATADTYLRQSSANQNQGQDVLLHVQQSGHNRVLVQMDSAAIVAAVGSGSLASASLELFVTGSTGWGTAGRTVDLHRMTASWTENGATWNCAVDSIPTNSQPNCTTQWDGGTFDDEASDSVLHLNTTSGFVQWNVTDDVQAFLAGTPNYGWLAKLSDETLGGNVDYASWQGSTAAQRPRLVLVVESPAFDQVPPSISITTPAHPFVINEPTPEIRIEFADHGSGIAPTTLAVSVDGIAATCTTAASGASCRPATLAQGNHAITASVRDQAGNQATATRSFTLLIGPGLRSATFAATADTTLKKSSANQNFGTDPTLRLRQSGKNRSLVRFDAAEIAQTIGQGTLRSASLELAVGASSGWGKTGRTVDAHRLTADWTEAGATWNCGIDTIPTNSAPNCTTQWAGGTFQPTPTATVSHTNGQTGRVPFDVTPDVAALLAGTPTYGWLVKKTDETQSGKADYAAREAGAATAPQLVIFFDVPASGDTTPPTIAITAPAAAVIYNQATPEIRVEYSDAGSGVNVAALRVLLDGTVLSGCQAGASAATCTATPLAPGAHRIDAEIADQAGNPATVHRDFTFARDDGEPEVRVTSPTVEAIYNATSLAIAASYSDQVSGLDLATFKATFDGAAVPCTIAPAGATCTVSSPADGQHTVLVEIHDLAGNVGLARVQFTTLIDHLPPDVRFVEPQGSEVAAGELLELMATYADAGAGTDADSVRIVVDGVALSNCTIGNSVAVCPAPPLAEGGHALVAEVRDLAGNLATANVALTVAPERQPPTIEITAPAEETFFGSRLVVSVAYADAQSGIDPASLAVAVDGEPLTCPALAAGATCEPRSLASGHYEITAEISDRKGNHALASKAVEVSNALAITIESPASGAVTSDATFRLAGTVSPSADSVKVGDVPATLSAGTWSVLVPVREGSNTLSAVATSSSGGVGTATVAVIRDSEAPRVAILTPRDGFVTSASQIVVSGDLVDSVSTSSKQRALKVLVNDHEATVERKSFVLTDLLLLPGENRIEVTAEDEAGNVGRSAITVRFVPDAVARIEEISGNFQEATIRDTLGQPLVVRIVDFLGRPLAGRTVDFAVTRGDGSLLSFPDAARKLSSVTNEEGLAAMRFALGTRAGAGNQEVTVSSVGIPGSVLFCASARPKPAKQVHPIAATDFQGAKTGPAGQAMPKPLFVQVFDGFGNPVAGQEVIFRSVEGGGTFAGAPEARVTTDDEGKAGAVFTLGPDEGINNNRVEVNFDGGTESPAQFIISGLIPGPAELTALAGIVLDPSDAPVPGARIHIGANETRTDAEGRFRLNGVPVGTVHVEIDGSTVTRPGTWPPLGYELVVISGRVNELGKPMRLPQIDDAGKKRVGGDQDVTIPIHGVAGAMLTVFAHSVTFPNGSHEGDVAFTQVPAQKVPMVAPQNAGFMLAWTIQPAGVRFDPPARVSIPNFGAPGGGGNRPGLTGEIFSFDHDLGEFVSAGTASITEDGRMMMSNPGMGISKAGWGGCPHPPAPPAQGCGKGTCSVCPVEGGPPVDKCDSCSLCTGGTAAGKSSSCTPKKAGTVEVSHGFRLGRFVVGVHQDFQLAAVVRGGDCNNYEYTWKRLDTGAFLGLGPKVTLNFPTPDLVPVSVEARCRDCGILAPATGGIPVDVVRLEIVDVQTPSLSAVPPSIKGSFVAPADEIVIRAQVHDKPDLDAMIRWEAIPINTETGPANPQTLDNSKEFHFRASSNQSTGGSRAANHPLGYTVKARLEIEGETVGEVTIDPGLPEVVQDEIDIIRQEYVDYHAVFQPTRGLISMPANKLLNTGNYTMIAEPTPGHLQGILDAVTQATNDLLNNDVQAQAPGTPNLAPTAPVVSMGTSIHLIGPIGSSQPEGDDVCTASRNGTCVGAVLAGPNGIAETHANNRHLAFNAAIAITSAFRNPQRNRAVGSVHPTTSFHTQGRALDLAPRNAPIPGLTDSEVMCLLEQAAQGLYGGNDAFVEQGATMNLPCNGAVDHVHVED
jgi:hypothetical protein